MLLPSPPPTAAAAVGFGAGAAAALPGFTSTLLQPMAPLVMWLRAHSGATTPLLSDILQQLRVRHHCYLFCTDMAVVAARQSITRLCGVEYPALTTIRQNSIVEELQQHLRFDKIDTRYVFLEISGSDSSAFKVLQSFVNDDPGAFADYALVLLVHWRSAFHSRIEEALREVVMWSTGSIGCHNVGILDVRAFDEWGTAAPSADSVVFDAYRGPVSQQLDEAATYNSALTSSAVRSFQTGFTSR